MDVFIEIINIQLSDNSSTKMLIHYWNKGQCGKPYALGIFDEIVIEKDKYNDWMRL